MSSQDLDNFLVSGFSDDDEGVDPTRNPTEEAPKQLLCAAENGDLATVKSLLDQDPTIVNSTDQEGYTALHRACYSNHVDVVKHLLQKGAGTGAKTEMMWQPLHSCCQWNSLQCAQVLIAEGADVNAVTEGGQTPLHIAATHGACYDMVQLLLMHPYIKPRMKNVGGETAEDIARRSSKYRNVFEMADPLLDVENVEID